MLRELIEDVKQDKIDESTTEKFIKLIQSVKERKVIIGCTEFPAILAKCKGDERLKEYELFDPLEAVIEKLREDLR